MDIDKEIIVNLVLGIHMVLIGIALFRLFRLKSATGGLVIISLLVMMIPILGPSGLIAYYNKLYEKEMKSKTLDLKRNQRRSR